MMREKLGTLFHHCYLIWLSIILSVYLFMQVYFKIISSMFLCNRCIQHLSKEISFTAQCTVYNRLVSVSRLQLLFYWFPVFVILFRFRSSIFEKFYNLSWKIYFDSLDDSIIYLARHKMLDMALCLDFL